jgi:hypothetical protein
MKFTNTGSLERYLALNGVKSIREAIDKKKGVETLNQNRTPLEMPRAVVKPKYTGNPWLREIHLLIRIREGRLNFGDGDETEE